MNDAMRVGKAGELRVASELLLRKFNPSLMLEISESDIILTNGMQIQVKASHISKNGRYCFNFKGWKRKKDGSRRQEIHDLKNIDIVILWAIDEDLFFIIPTKEIRVLRGYAISFTANPKKKQISEYGYDWFMQYKNKWELLNS